MKENPLVSVIVPIYKVEKYLPKCIESIISQSYSNLEIILIDDGSPDNCLQICELYKAQDSRIIVVHKENGGLSDARNIGLDICKGEYISFIDSDDFISTSFIETMLSALLRTKTDIVSTNYNIPRFKDEEEKEVSFPTSIDIEKAQICSVDEALMELLYQKIPNAVQLRIYKKSLFNEIRFPKGWIFEDVATVHKIFIKAKKIAIIDAPLYAYRIRDNSIVRMKFSSAKMVVIPITRNLFHEITTYNSMLIDAASSRAFSQNYHVYLQIPYSDQDDIKKVWNEMIKYRKRIIRDKSPLLRKKTRIAAFLTYFGKAVSYYIGRAYINTRNY